MLAALKSLFRKPFAPELLHVLHTEGLESFPPSRAVFTYYTTNDGRRLLVLHLRCGKPLIQIEQFKNVFHPEPWLEVIFHRPLDETELPIGNALTLPVGYDHVHDENITHFSYASHESIEKIKLVVTSWSEDRARFKFSGLTGAAHNTNDTRIYFDIEFLRDPNLRRSFN